MKTIITLLFCFIFFSANAQEAISFRNPSFEIRTTFPYGEHPCCLAPRGWFSCGTADDNTPDSQPGHFNVELPSLDKKYYLGMVTRDDDTWEAVSQRLSDSLIANTDYYFSAALARSDSLESFSRVTKLPSSFNRPVKLRVWAGDGYCDKAELLAETKAIINTNWKYYFFHFKPNANYHFITFEAFYVTPSPVPYNGNILMDDFSAIEVDSTLLKIEEDSRFIEPPKIK